MSDIYYLVHDEARHRASARCLEAPEGYKVTFSMPKRSDIQSAKLHAMFADFSKQYMHCGKYWDAEDIKRLLIDEFRRETSNDVEFRELWRSMGTTQMIPSLRNDGFVMLGAQSRNFPVKLAAGMIEWLYALGAELNIVWSEPKQLAIKNQA